MFSLFVVRTRLAALLISLALAASTLPALAQVPANSGEAQQAKPASTIADQQQAELSSAWKAASQAATYGPETVKLLKQGELKVPDGMAFVPSAEAGRVLRAYGNVVGSNLVGLLTGTGEDGNWLAVIRFIKEGYIKDDDAKDWNADDLLSNLRVGNDEANVDRVGRGFPKLELIGWVEKPAYDPVMHRLVWSLASRTEGELEEADRSVNYNTYALGREGYFSLNLLTTQRLVETHKPVAHSLLANLTYVAGKRYDEFDSATDEVAAYGLAALVGGVAAKKLGLFAVIFAFLAKFAKVGVVALIALGAVVAKVFKRSKKEADAAPAKTSSASDKL